MNYAERCEGEVPKTPRQTTLTTAIFLICQKIKQKSASSYPFTRPISVDDFETTKEELSLYEIGLPSDN